MIIRQNQKFSLWTAVKKEIIICTLIGSIPVLLCFYTYGLAETLQTIQSLLTVRMVTNLFGVYACFAISILVTRIAFTPKRERTEKIFTHAKPYLQEGISAFHGALRLGCGASLGYGTLCIMSTPSDLSTYTPALLVWVFSLSLCTAIAWFFEIFKIYNPGSRASDYQ